MNRKKILSVVLLIVVIGALPKWVPIPSKATLRAQEEQNRNEVATLKERIAIASEASKDTLGLDAKIKEINSAIPDGPDLPKLIDDIGKVAFDAGLSWVAGSPQKVPGSDGADQPIWTISVSLTGQKNSLPAFFDGLRGSDRIITVDTVSYQTSPTGDINATAVLRFYASSVRDMENQD